MMIIIIILCLLSESKTANEVDYEKYLDYKDLNSIFDLSEKILKYYSRQQEYIDLVAAVGIYMYKVHLKWTLLYSNSSLLKNNLTNKLSSNVRWANALIELFEFRAESRVKTPNIAKDIYSLFSDEVLWLTGLRSFASKRKTEQRTKKANISRASRHNFIRTYDANVFGNYDNINLTSLSHSDHCLLMIANNTLHTSRFPGLCHIDTACIDLYDDIGSNYDATHRAFWLLLARLGRGCFLLGKEKDDETIEDICDVLYLDVEHNAEFRFQLNDLALEQIATCALNGDTRFFKQYLINGVLNRCNTHKGCYCHVRVLNGLLDLRRKIEDSRINKDETRNWSIYKNNYDLYGQCDGQVTSLALATAGAAIRYIIETD